MPQLQNNFQPSPAAIDKVGEIVESYLARATFNDCIYFPRDDSPTD
jgi:hypothetical protein